jgi:fluoroquinolone resistance protein
MFDLLGSGMAAWYRGGFTIEPHHKSVINYYQFLQFGKRFPNQEPLMSIALDDPARFRAELKQGKRQFEKLTFAAADLSHLDLGACSFDACDLTGADFRFSDLRDAQMNRCKMAQARLDGVKGNGARFNACDLAGSQWRRARIDGACFSDCRMTGAHLGIDVGLLGAGFVETRLVAATLIGLSFRKMHLERLDFSEADLRGCDFREAIFTGCSLRDATFKDCRFKGADLRGCELGHLSVGQAKIFEGAIISPDQAAEIMTRFGFVVA